MILYPQSNMEKAIVAFSLILGALICGLYLSGYRVRITKQASYPSYHCDWRNLTAAEINELHGTAHVYKDGDMFIDLYNGNENLKIGNLKILVDLSDPYASALKNQDVHQYTPKQYLIHE